MVGRQQLQLGSVAAAVAARLASWEERSFPARLWAKDHTLWVERLEPEIVDRLGWLTLPESSPQAVDDYTAFAAAVRGDGVRHVVLLGMGGSSLAPEVFSRVFGAAPGYPELIVLDSTHPEAVLAVRRAVDLASTLFIVSSKSGTTIEPLSLYRYFRAELEADATTGPGDRFVAVTDPGSPLAGLAAEAGFRRVFEADPDVGGRYSALTAFGLVPATLIGVDAAALLQRARAMAAASGPSVPPHDSPGLVLGAALGEAARAGRDKATFVVSPSLAAFPDWVEQLIAESTGKEGTGIVPVTGEPIGAAGDYGPDRFFVHLEYAGDADEGRGAAMDGLAAAGHPVASIHLADLADLAAEMYRFEVATAAAGAVLGIHPFNQPDVQAAKELAADAMAGRLDAGAVVEVPVADRELLGHEVAHLMQGRAPGDYVALHAYLAPTPATAAALERIRHGLRPQGLPTTIGYGPRFLHSTGQLHKGGPNTGLFIQLVDEPADPVPVPGTDYSFGELIAGQSRGDYLALRAAGRRVLRVQLGRAPSEGLNAVTAAVHAVPAAE